MIQSYNPERFITKPRIIAITKGCLRISIAKAFFNWPLLVSFDTKIGTNKNAMIDPARSKITVLLDLPTIDKYKGRATAPPSTEDKRKCEK